MLILNEHIPRPAVKLDADENSQIDQEAIIEQIWIDLGGTASRTDIRKVVLEVAPRYADAHIMTFVPIFLGREVRRRLLRSS